MISGSIIWWGLAALLLFWSVGAYNRLVRLRSRASRTFAALALLLQRYGELLHDYSATPTTGVQSQAWTGLHGAQVQFAASLAVARLRPLDAASINALAAADQVLQMAWLRVATEGQDPYGQPLPEILRQPWDGMQPQVAIAKQSFAQAVHSYNLAIAQFPAILLAWLFGFRAAKPL